MLKLAAIQLIDPDKAKLPKTSASPDILQTLFAIFFSFMGALAVLMILIAAFKYVFAGGDSQKVSSAKNTMIHAAIGLVIIALSYAIVSYVIKLTT